MGEVLRKGASTERSFRDARLTWIAASYRGGASADAAERFLAPRVHELTTLTRALKRAEEDLDAARADQTAAVCRCDDAVAALHDEFYNQIGRHRSDPVYRLVYPSGFSVYTRVPTRAKPEAVRTLADRLGMVTHRRLGPAWTRAAVATLEAVAEDLRGLNGHADARAAERDALQRQYVLAGQLAQQALVRLKLHLRSLGITESEIHQILPNRKRDRTKAEASAEGPAASATGAAPAAAEDATERPRAPVLTLVPPAAEPGAPPVAEAAAAERRASEGATVDASRLQPDRPRLDAVPLPFGIRLPPPAELHPRSGGTAPAVHEPGGPREADG